MAKYRIIVAGTRHFKNREYVYAALDHYLKDLDKDEIEVLDGGAVGPDMIGGDYAREHNLGVLDFPADWDTYGKGAGFIRNQAMADVATHLIAFWDEESRGTKDMIDRALKAGSRVVVIKYKKRNIRIEE